MYKVIFCDLDGTLLEDSERHYQCYCDIVAKYGGKCISKEEYWQDKRNKEKRTVLLEKSHFEGSYADYLNTWNEWIEQEKYLRLEVPKPYMLEALALLKMHADSLVLVTMRQDMDALRCQLKKIDILQYFDKIIKGNPAKESKAELIPEKFGKDALVIGDTEADWELAESIGSQFIAVTSGLRDKKYLEGADWLVEGLEEIRTFLN